MKWKGKIIEWLQLELQSDNSWEVEYKKMMKGDSAIGIHLAVFGEPYLSLLLEGAKTVESRFSIKNVSPFGRVAEGDIILIKNSGGPVCGGFIADSVKYYDKLNSRKFAEIEQSFGKAICSHVDANFWSSRASAKFATLIAVRNVKHFQPFQSQKPDRTGWTVIRSKASSLFDKQI